MDKIKPRKDKLYKKTKIIITVGDEAGIGPEVILKALGSSKLPKNIEILIVGSKQKLISTYELLKDKKIENIINPEKLSIEEVEIPAIKTLNKAAISGNASFYYLKRAIKIVQEMENAALVTGPICKKSWGLAGHNYSGQTELLAELCNSDKVGMLFTAKSPLTGWRFNTLLATTHIPLSQIPKQLTPNLLKTKLDLLYYFCKKFNNKPTLRIAGLNPHAGEGGLLGNEDINIIEKSLKSWAKENPNVNIEGPLSPDSCWIESSKAWKDKNENLHDGILAMYHDQGLIPMKIIAATYSVNTTLGLPIIRTSPDHGTGFDIAGEGVAQHQSMLEAIKTAYELQLRS